MPATRSSTQKDTPVDTPVEAQETAGVKRKLEDEDVQFEGEADDEEAEEEEAVASPARPAKIPKLDVVFEMHETHWYLDGNVLLQTGKKMFKVHRSRLASISSWFQIFFDVYLEKECPDYDALGEDDQAYIDAMLESELTVTGLPLFYLDCEGHDCEVPTPDQFAALLNGIYNGINYAFDHPSIDELVLLAQTAVMFDAETLVSYAANYLKVVFPRNPFDLSNEPSVYVAVQGVRLARMDARFEILATALYDLARAPIPSIQDFMAFTPQNLTANQSAAAQLVKANLLKANEANLSPILSKAAKLTTFRDLNYDDFLRLHVLQKHLFSAWDEILQDILSIIFSRRCGGQCTLRLEHADPVLKKLSIVKSKNPSDIIIGIKMLLNDNLLKPYCRPCNNELTLILKNRRSAIWRKIRTEWIR